MTITSQAQENHLVEEIKNVGCKIIQTMLEELNLEALAISYSTQIKNLDTTEEKNK